MEIYRFDPETGKKNYFIYSTQFCVASVANVAKKKVQKTDWICTMTIVAHYRCRKLDNKIYLLPQFETLLT